MASQKVVADDLTVGFLGAGRMAQALASGFVASGLVKANNITASDIDDICLSCIKKDVGVNTTADNLEVVGRSDVVILAVKPHIVPDVLQQLRSSISHDKLVISIAAGVTLKSIQTELQEGSRVVRVMPNTPALVHCGASVYSPGVAATAEDGHLVAALFSSIGVCDMLPERYLDAVTGLSGSGPAYGFLAVEALADGGVRMGLPRPIALKLAAQTLMGAAKMVLETGKHPGELKDGVCSPGGTTIAGVHQLEISGYRAALMNAVEAAATRSKQLGEES